MKIIKEITNTTVEEICSVLANGGLVIYPTETCYGIGCDATNQTAVNKLLDYKSRREGKPISVAVTDEAMASIYVEVNETASNIYRNYLPGPITVVSKSLGKVAKGIESEFGTLGIRIPKYDLVLQIVHRFGKPVTSTSANMSYQKVPYIINELLSDLPEKQKKLIDLIVDVGELPKNPPSTVVDTTLNNTIVMRQGKISFESSIGSKQALVSAITESPEETQNLGAITMLKYLDNLRDKCIIFALSGDLGAGKTQFTKGIGRQLGIKQIIKSPTYNLVQEYQYELGDKKGFLVHIDTWRVDGDKELSALKYEEYLCTGNILSIEWIDKFFEEISKKFDPEKVILFKVRLKHISEYKRQIEIFN